MTRTILFHKVLDIDTKFYGKVVKEGYLEKLKKWFYYGFPKRNYPSIKILSIVGKKIPKDWEEKMIEMKGGVNAKQKPGMRPCGKIHIACVRYSHFFN